MTYVSILPRKTHFPDVELNIRTTKFGMLRTSALTRLELRRQRDAALRRIRAQLPNSQFSETLRSSRLRHMSNRKGGMRLFSETVVKTPDPGCPGRSRPPGIPGRLSGFTEARDSKYGVGS